MLRLTNSNLPNQVLPYVTRGAKSLVLQKQHSLQLRAPIAKIAHYGTDSGVDVVEDHLPLAIAKGFIYQLQPALADNIKLHSASSHGVLRPYETVFDIVPDSYWFTSNNNFSTYLTDHGNRTAARLQADFGTNLPILTGDRHILHLSRVESSFLPIATVDSVDVGGTIFTRSLHGDAQPLKFILDADGDLSLYPGSFVFPEFCAVAIAAHWDSQCDRYCAVGQYDLSDQTDVHVIDQVDFYGSTLTPVQDTTNPQPFEFVWNLETFVLTIFVPVAFYPLIHLAIARIVDPALPTNLHYEI